MLTGFDLIILIILLAVFISGFKKGMIRMLIGLSIIILSAIFGGKVALYLLPYINKMSSLSPQWANLVAYLSAFLIISMILTSIGNLIHKLFKIIFLGFVNRLIGGLIAMGSVMVILSIFLNLILIIDPNEELISRETKRNSFFYERIQSVVPAIVPYLNIERLEDVIPKDFIEPSQQNNNTLIIKSEIKNLKTTNLKPFKEINEL